MEFDFRKILGDKVGYDASGQVIWGIHNENELQKVLDIRSWGAIQNLFKRKNHTIDFHQAEKYQDAMGKWIAEAINEKLKREQ